MSRDPNNITVADITQLYVREQNNPELLHRAAQLEALPENWRDYFHRADPSSGCEIDQPVVKRHHVTFITYKE